jgi:hypothetical protein
MTEEFVTVTQLSMTADITTGVSPYTYEWSTTTDFGSSYYQIANIYHYIHSNGY